VVTAVMSGLATGFSQGISVFFKPIAAELGINRAVTSVATSISRLEGGIQSPITGILADKFEAKWIILTGAFVLGTGLLLMKFVVDSAWTYFIVWGVIVGTGHNVGFTIAVDKLLTNWFVTKRGLSFGVRFAIVGIMQVMVIPIVSWLTTNQGWRNTCFTWGILMYATMFLVLYFVRKSRPEDMGLLPDGDEVEVSPVADTSVDKSRKVENTDDSREIEFTLKQAMKTSSFWILAIARSSFILVIGGFNLHCINFLTDRGIEPGIAASLMSMMLFFTIPSRFLFGLLTDRLPKERQKFILSGAFLLMTIGITSFLLYPTTAMIFVFFILWGFGYGGITPADITIRSRYFGRKAYGSIQGITNLVSSPFSFFGPIYAGWIFDLRGSYTTAFITFAAIAAFTAVLLSMIRAPGPPSQSINIYQA
jgi:sugar phosphate permease